MASKTETKRRQAEPQLWRPCSPLRDCGKFQSADKMQEGGAEAGLTRALPKARAKCARGSLWVPAEETPSAAPGLTFSQAGDRCCQTGGPRTVTVKDGNVTAPVGSKMEEDKLKSTAFNTQRGILSVGFSAGPDGASRVTATRRLLAMPPGQRAVPRGARTGRRAGRRAREETPTTAARLEQADGARRAPRARGPGV